MVTTKHTIHRTKHYLYSALVTILLAVPLVMIIIPQIGRVAHNFWLHSPNLGALTTILGNYMLGYNAPVYAFFISIVLIILLLLFWLIKSEKNTLFFVLFGYALLPIFAIFIFAQSVPVFLPRHLILFSPYIYIIISVSLNQMRNKLVILFVSSTLISLFIITLSNYYAGVLPSPIEFHRGVVPKKPFRSIVEDIRSKIREGDVIAHSNLSTIQSFVYYMRDMRDDTIFQWYLLFHPEEIRTFQRTIPEPHRLKEYPFDRGKGRWLLYYVVEMKDDNTFYNYTTNKRMPIAGNLWLITANWLRDPAIYYHSQRLLNQLDSAYTRIDHFYSDGIYVTVYAID